MCYLKTGLIILHHFTSQVSYFYCKKTLILINKNIVLLCSTTLSQIGRAKKVHKGTCILSASDFVYPRISKNKQQSVTVMTDSVIILWNANEVVCPLKGKKSRVFFSFCPL